MRVTRLLPLIIAFMTSGAGHALADSAKRIEAVVELFTSQGCSACPAADALISQYRNRPGILALSLPVDLWDYLGWRDTLASPAFSKRQRDYAAVRNDNNVYTPQVVVNGLVQTKGNNMPAVEAAIAEAGKTGPLQVAIRAWTDGSQVVIDVGSRQPATASSGTVWLATVRPEVPVEVKHGENRGKTLTYHNVVRTLSPVGTWTGSTLKLTLPLAEMLDKDERCAVFVQTGHNGPIVAAAWMTSGK